MHKKLLLALALAISLTSQANAKAKLDVVSIPTIGLQVTKPKAWHHLSAQANSDNLRKMELDDKALQQAIVRQAAVPIVAFTKYLEPYPNLNPSFKINVRPLQNLPTNAVELLQIIVPGAQKTVGAELEQQPVATTVSGLPAAYVRLSYVLNSAGAQYPTISELWIVPRGSYFFMIGAGTRQDESNGSRAEVKAIIDSIRIATK
jgi:hypothetical protein